MNALPDRCDPAVEEKLSVLSPVPAREPEAVARGRARFLAEARALQPVKQPTKPSRNGWFGALAASLQIKKRAPALIVLASIAVVFAILLGGTTATVYAAQGSMPGQLLYSVKLLSEDIRLGLTSEPQAELTLISELVNRRLEEIDYLVETGEDVPDYLVDRLDAQLDQAMSIATITVEDGDTPVSDGVQIFKRPRDQDSWSSDPEDRRGEEYRNCETNEKGENPCVTPDDESSEGSGISGEGQPGDGTDNTSGSGAGNQGSSGSTDGTGSGSGQQPVNPPSSSGSSNGPDPLPDPTPDPNPNPVPDSGKDPGPAPDPNPTPDPVPVQNCEGDNCPITDPAQVPPVSDDGSSSGDSSGDPSGDPSGDGNKSP
jgi:hypothetical protein